MRREGWIYAIAFFAILGVGALIIVPRLDRAPAGDDGGSPYVVSVSDVDTVREPAREAGPAVKRFAGKPAYDWVTVTVTGTEGGLRGPLREVHGADVEAQTAPDERTQTLAVRPHGPAVVFGAVGHQWVRRSAASLAEQPRVELPDAAPALVVRVRETDGRPAVGVPVAVRPAAPGAPPRTDDGGTVVLDHLPRGLVLLDFASTLRSGPRLRLRAGEDRKVRVVLDPAWYVSGRVRDRRGDPVAGADVTAFGPRGVLGTVVKTARDGSFRWSGPAVARLALAVRATGWAERRVEVEPPAVGPLRTDAGTIALQHAGVTIDGVVQSVFTAPDAHVVVEPAVAALVRELFGPGQLLDQPRRVPLGADGRFRVHDLPAGLPLRIAVRGAGVPVDVIVEGKPGEEVPVELTPSPGEALVGTLRMPDGKPAAGVRLLLSQEPRDGDSERPGDVVVLSGADGTFARRGLVGRTWYLRAYAPGKRSLLQRVVLPLGDPLELAFEERVTDAGRRVEGRIYDGVRTNVKTAKDDPWVGEASEIRYGTGLAGITVRAAGVSAVTDAQGRFLLEGVESLAPTVRLAWGFDAGPLAEEAPDPRPYVPADALDVTPGGKALDLLLPRAASLSFRARDAVDDRPLAFVHVVVRTDRGRVVVDRGLAPRDGLVTLHGLPPRGVELTVLARDRRYHRAPIVLRPGKHTDLEDILLRRGMHIDGRVVDTKGKPIPGARVGAYGKGWQHGTHDPGAERELIFRTAVTDAQGRFQLRGFDPRKPADLAVWAEGYAPTAVRVALPKFSDVVRAEPEVKLVAGAYLALDLHASGWDGERGPRVHGALLDLEFAYGGSDYLDLVHRGMLGGVVASSEAWRHASQHLLFERRGFKGYLVGPLRPGPYDLWVERLGYGRLRRKITVIDPEQAWMVDLVSGKETKLRGRVTRLPFELEPVK